MNCKQAEILIQKRLDGLLPQTERWVLDAHLGECTACRREWDAQRRLAQLAGRWSSHTLSLSDPGEAFTAQVLSRLDAPPKPSRRVAWLPAAAALLLLALLFLVPGVQEADLGRLMPALQRLPLWLDANLSALPGDARALVRLPQDALLPSWISLLLPVIFALNGLFCLVARRSAATRSAS